MYAFKKYQSRGRKEDTADKVLAWHAANPGSISGTMCDPLSIASSDPWALIAPKVSPKYLRGWPKIQNNNSSHNKTPKMQTKHLLNLTNFPWETLWSYFLIPKFLQYMFGHVYFNSDSLFLLENNEVLSHSTAGINMSLWSLSFSFLPLFL